MDFQSYNRAVINRDKIEWKLDYKTMVFIVPRFVQTGVIKTELPFPHEGRIVDIKATCGVPSLTESTEISVEKCSEVDYDTVPVWTNILSSNIVIDDNHKSSRTSVSPYAISDSNINLNDHFRINVIHAGHKVEDITITINVEINTSI